MRWALGVGIGDLGFSLSELRAGRASGPRFGLAPMAFAEAISAGGVLPTVGFPAHAGARRTLPAPRRPHVAVAAPIPIAVDVNVARSGSRSVVARIVRRRGRR